MKTVQKRIGFIARSLGWSLLLYIVLMLAFNWDEVKGTVNGRKIAVVVNDGQEGDVKGTTNIDRETGLVHGVLMLIRHVSGILTFAR